jgi:hypothetical protein
MLRVGAGKIPSWVVYCLLALAACGSEAATGESASETGASGHDAPGGCPEVAPSEPITLEARIEVIAAGQSFIGTFGPLDMPSLVADASGVYWYDASGGVYARQGSSAAVTLQPGNDTAGTSRWPHVVGITADAERLYVAEAFLEAAVDYFPAPQFQAPGRLLSYPKVGGPAQVLLELEDSTIYPFATDGGRIVALVIDAEGNGGYYQVDPLNPQLERLPMRLTPGGNLELNGGALYWSDDQSPPNLFRTGFDDPDPEVVRSLRSSTFDVGPGYILSIEDQIIQATGHVAQSFVVHGAATDTDRTLPGLGELISFRRALDARHVYWYSYEGYDGVGSLEDHDPHLQLVRANITCGTLEKLATPGLVPDSAAEIVGQYGGTLYIENGGALFAVQKP